MNEVPDRNADARAGKRTLVVRLGAPGTRVLYLCLHVGASAALLLAGALQFIPWWMSVLGLGLLPGAWRASQAIRKPFERARLKRAIETTLRLHTAGTGLLAAAILLAVFR
jgi:1,4-dihydroxy-2-naphthoate octaprenyltransferase